MGRGDAMQRTGREVLVGKHGQHPRQTFYGNLGKRTGTESPCNGKEVPEELLDGGHSKPRDAQVHQISSNVGIEEQVAFHARKADVHRPEVVRRGAGSVSRRFKGEVLISLDSFASYKEPQGRQARNDYDSCKKKSLFKAIS